MRQEVPETVFKEQGKPKNVQVNISCCTWCGLVIIINISTPVFLLQMVLQSKKMHAKTNKKKLQTIVDDVISQKDL